MERQHIKQNSLYALTYGLQKDK